MSPSLLILIILISNYMFGITLIIFFLLFIIWRLTMLLRQDFNGFTSTMRRSAIVSALFLLGEIVTSTSFLFFRVANVPAEQISFTAIIVIYIYKLVVTLGIISTIFYGAFEFAYDEE